MSITTKTGDDGTTALFGGTRVRKDSPQVEAYGALDEATSCIGLARESISDKKTKDMLSDIQFHLYLIMAYLSGAKLDVKRVVNNLTYIEKSIQQLESGLPKLIRFILPQGSEQAARLHVARTIVRSAERRVVQYVNNKNKVKNDDIVLQYLNRLSDLLFILARKYSQQEVAMKEV